MTRLYALLIGIDFYPRGGDDAPPLSCAVNDVEAVHRALAVSRDDLEATLLVNADATIPRIRRGLARIRDEIRGSDRKASLLIYFAGHGIPVETQAGLVGYLLTHDYSGRREDLLDPSGTGGGFTVAQLRDWFVGTNNKDGVPESILLLVDACYAGAAAGMTTELARLNGEKWGVKSRFGHRAAGGSGPVVPAGHQFLTSAPAEWTPRTKVAIVMAADGDKLAVEDYEEGHGLFTKAVLEWLEEAIEAGKDVPDVASAILSYVKPRISAFPGLKNSAASRLQKPTMVVSRQISVSFADGWKGAARRRGYSLFDVLPSGPTRGMSIDYVDRQVDKVRKALKDPFKSVDESNLLVTCASPFLTRPIFGETIRRLRREIEAPLELRREIEALPDALRPILYVSSHYASGPLPLRGAIVDWLSERFPRSRLEEVLPAVDVFEPEGRIARMVDQLESVQAIVVVSYWPESTSSEIQAFIAECARRKDLKLVVILNGSVEIPPRLLWAPYRKVVLGRYTIDGHVNTEERSILEHLPQRVQTPRLAGWLRRLKDRTDLLGEESRTQARKGNRLRLYVQVVRRLIEKMEQGSRIDKDAVSLLRCLSFARLPRCRLLVEAAWKVLSQQPVGAKLKVLDPAVPLDDLLRTLHEWDLASTSPCAHEDIAMAGSGPPLPSDRLFFVHYAVQRAMTESTSETDKAACHGLLAWAYELCLQAIAKSPGVGHKWRPAVFAYQAIHHALEADDTKRVVELIGRHRKSLIGAGYHEQLLAILDRLRDRSELDPSDAVRILLREQTLRRRRQEWAHMQRLHAEIEHRTGAERTPDRSWRTFPKAAGEKERTAFANTFWRSRVNLGIYHLARRDYIRAQAEYEECRQAAVMGLEQVVGEDAAAERQRRGWLDIETDALYRLAECHVHRGQLAIARRLAAELHASIARIRDPSLRRHKDFQAASLDFEIARANEEAGEMHRLAVKGLDLVFERVRQGDDMDQLQLAIASIQMAWACYFRGEHLRGFRHGVAARWTLERRDIPELWWVGECECIVALALAKMARGAASHKPTGQTSASDSPWKSPASGQPVRFTFGHKGDGSWVDQAIERQMQLLTRLSARLGSIDPWRHAEIESARLQLAAARDGTLDEDGFDRVHELSLRHSHRVLEGYLLDFYASRAADPAHAYDSLLESCEIAADGEVPCVTFRRAWQCTRLALGLERKGGLKSEQLAALCRATAALREAAESKLEAQVRERLKQADLDPDGQAISAIVSQGPASMLPRLGFDPKRTPRRDPGDGFRQPVHERVTLERLPRGKKARARGHDRIEAEEHDASTFGRGLYLTIDKLPFETNDELCLRRPGDRSERVRVMRITRIDPDSRRRRDQWLHRQGYRARVGVKSLGAPDASTAAGSASGGTSGS